MCFEYPAAQEGLFGVSSRLNQNTSLGLIQAVWDKKHTSAPNRRVLSDTMFSFCRWFSLLCCLIRTYFFFFLIRCTFNSVLSWLKVWVFFFSFLFYTVHINKPGCLVWKKNPSFSLCTSRPTRLVTLAPNFARGTVGLWDWLTETGCTCHQCKWSDRIG